jgi:hypothetical protein
MAGERSVTEVKFVRLLKSCEKALLHADPAELSPRDVMRYKEVGIAACRSEFVFCFVLR